MRTGCEKQHGGCWECVRGTADTQQLLLKGSQHHAEATFSAKDLFALKNVPVSPGKTLAAISKCLDATGWVAKVNRYKRRGPKVFWQPR